MANLEIPGLYERFPLYDEEGNEVAWGLRKFGEVATTFAFGPTEFKDHLARHTQIKKIDGAPE